MDKTSYQPLSMASTSNSEDETNKLKSKRLPTPKKKVNKGAAQYLNGKSYQDFGSRRDSRASTSAVTLSSGSDISSGICSYNLNAVSDSDEDSDEIYVRKPSHGCHSFHISSDRVVSSRLYAAAILTVIFMTIQGVGGYLSWSLSVLFNAGHLLGDFCGLLVTMAMCTVSKRQPSTTMNFGYFRAEVIGSAVSLQIMWTLSAFLMYLAIDHAIYHTYLLIDPDIMIVTSGIGVISSIILAIVIRGGICSASKGRRRYYNRNQLPDIKSVKFSKGVITSPTAPMLGKVDENGLGEMIMRTTLNHFYGDIILSAIVFTVAVIIKYMPEWCVVDTIVTLLSGVIVLTCTATYLRQLTKVLMEGTPSNIEYSSVLSDLEGLPGVRSVHSLHIWSLSLNRSALAVHLAIDTPFEFESIREVATNMLRVRYRIYYSVVQVEKFRTSMKDCRQCQPLK